MKRKTKAVLKSPEQKLVKCGLCGGSTDGCSAPQCVHLDDFLNTEKEKTHEEAAEVKE